MSRSNQRLPAGASAIPGLLLPAPAQRPVELHEAFVLVASRLRQCEFSGKERTLAVQHFQISCRAAAVTHIRKAYGLLQIRNRLFLPHANLMIFLISDQRIGYISKCALDGLLVREQSLLVL